MHSKEERILIRNEATGLPLSKKETKRLTLKILNLLKEELAGVSLYFVNDAKMRRLNLKYRKTGGTTDCLAFSMREGEGAEARILGDVVISVETTKRNARLFGSTVKREIVLNITHGILHLLGFKDTSASLRRKMQKKQEEIIERI